MQDKYIGKRLDGRYEIHELVGVGGMAYVYLAYDRLEDRWVAIKILKEEFSTNSDFLRRFRNESKAIALLSCDNIVKIFDVSFGDKIQYIVMEYLDGITLKQYIEQQGTVRWQEAIHFMTQILTALECAHKKDIIHRDIKPQNIILLSDGTIKVTDFGIARFLQNETQTMTDTAIGSVHYISPEQAKGGYITDRADIYSTGVMLYEMLTGKLPFVADSAVSVALMQLQAKPVSPREINPSIPLGLEQITMHAMEKNPVNRFISAGEMLEDIEKFRLNPQISFSYNAMDETAVYNKAQTAPNTNDYEVIGDVPDYDDHYEYEEELVKSNRRRKGGMVVKGIIAAVLLILSIIGINYGIQALKSLEKKEDDTVVMPDFVNKNYETEIANNTELYKDFRFKLESGNQPDKEPGIVLRQEPESGIRVKKNKEVTLWINRGEEEPVTVPDLTGLDQTQAAERLEEVGLKSKIKAIPHDEIEEGKVIRTDPVMGSSVQPGVTILVYISQGPSQRQVPVPNNLIGMTLDEATTAITNAGLTVGEQTMDDESDKPQGTVIGVSPEEGKKLAEGSKVDLVISSGKGVSVSLNFPLQLPNVDQDVTVRVYRNGTLEEETNVNLAMKGIYPISFSGKVTDVDTVTVKLDDQLFIELSFDYGNNAINRIQSYEFVPTTKETPPPVQNPDDIVSSDGSVSAE